MSFRGFKRIKGIRLPAAIVLAAMMTTNPAMTQQAMAEPMDEMISEMDASEPVLPDAVDSEPDHVEDTEESDTMDDSASVPVQPDDCTPEIPDESEGNPDPPPDWSTGSKTDHDDSESDSSGIKPPSGKEEKPKRTEGKEKKKDKKKDKGGSLNGTEEYAEPTLPNQQNNDPEVSGGQSDSQMTTVLPERIITLPEMPSADMLPASRPRMKLTERKTEEYKLTKEIVMTTAETVHAQLNVRTGKGTGHKVAGRIRKGGVFFLIDDKDDKWAYIETEDAGHHVLRGYVLRELITETDAKDRFKKYGDRYRSYVQVSITEKDNPVFGDFKETVYRHIVTEHTRITYEWKSEDNAAQNEAKTSGAAADRTEMIQYARQFLGNPYVWGGESLTDGCDCSGFTMQVYRHFGIELPRCSYEQAEVGIRLNAEDALPGDLLFYARNGTIYHVLMYIGDGKAINASSSMTGIIISNVDYDKTCWGVRLIDSDAVEGDYEPDHTNYSQSDLELIWAIVAQEDDKSYEGALAVISSAMNRADKNYGGYGQSVLEQLTADGQYCYSPKVSDPSLYQRRLGGNVADFVKEAVSDCLEKGVRNHDYLNFRSSNRTGQYTRIGDNWYF